MTNTYENARIVRGDIKTGRRPHIYLEGARYTNQILCEQPKLIGKRVILVVNPDDIRTLEARLGNGKKLGNLEIMDRRFHGIKSLAERRRLMKQRRDCRVARATSEDSAKIYLKYLEKKSQDVKKRFKKKPDED